MNSSEQWYSLSFIRLEFGLHNVGNSGCFNCCLGCPSTFGSCEYIGHRYRGIALWFRNLLLRLADCGVVVAIRYRFILWLCSMFIYQFDIFVFSLQKFCPHFRIVRIHLFGRQPILVCFLDGDNPNCVRSPVFIVNNLVPISRQ